MANKPNNVSDLLAEVFRRGGMKRGVKRAEAVLLWPQVVGPEVAKFTEAKSVQDGILFVEVSDSETAMHLMLQRQRFLDVYRGKYGVRDIKELRFRVGYRPPPPPQEAPPAEVPVDPKALAKLARDLGALDLPDDVAQPAMKAAKAMLACRARREALGWRPCPICDTLTEAKGICDVCRRYMEQPAVKRASHMLAVDPSAPTPFLSDDERLVAIHLAKAYLNERLQELLPQVLADPTFKPHLESAAHCYLAHLLNKNIMEIGDDDLDRLEPRVARALGRWR